LQPEQSMKINTQIHGMGRPLLAAVEETTHKDLAWC